jgi:heme-degrading monooxygenase HmoA
VSLRVDVDSSEGRETMFARMARYEIPSGRVDEAVESFKQAASRLDEIGGVTGGYLLVDRDEGSLVTITVYDGRVALEASRTRASALRQQAVKTVDGSVHSVAEYEIAADFKPDSG